MARVTSGLSASQLRSVRKVATPAEIPGTCPQNFNGFSECYAAIAFYDILPNGNATTKSLNYTILADSGLFHIDVVRHDSDFEKRVLPLQWAVDQVRDH